MELHEIVLGAIILGVAAAAQSAVGFGYALVATPLLVWTGIPLPQVVALVATCSCIQAGIGAHRLRCAVPWRLTLSAVAVRVLAVVAGLAALQRLTRLDPAGIRLTVGVLLCALVVFQRYGRPRPTDTIHRGWAALAFASSGFLAGLVGMGGPPLVAWTMARHQWTSQKTRGFLFSVFLLSIPVQLILMGLRFGPELLPHILAGIAFSPIVYAGSHAGLAVGHRMSVERLRAVAYLFLLALGLSAVLPFAWARLGGLWR